ncbi:MAG: four helix bundle protein [Ruminococcaceae bacterium]|nr:four helix bundle protein [Oscillospiraceae bacterium]
MAILEYKDLLVWQKGMDIVEETYQLTKLLPKEEIYALSNQMRRAAVSILSNIAEGQQRKSTKEFANFLSISRGSVAELETQLYICVRLNYLTAEQVKKSLDMCAEIGKMLNSLIEK